MNNENITFDPTVEELSVKKKKNKFHKIIIGVILFSLLFSPIYFICAGFGIIPNKSDAKDSAKHRIENIVDVYYNATVSDIKIKSCKHNSFIKESKDKYGFFDYAMNNSITDGESGKEYTNYKDFFKDQYGVDIYTARKNVYTIKGNCTVTDSKGISSEKDFSITIVQLSGTNFKMSINDEYIFNESQDVGQIIKNDVIAYATLTYKDVKTCRVAITDKEQHGDEITAYGKVYITDHYGDSYTCRFKATYEHISGFDYQKKDLEISTPYADN